MKKISEIDWYGKGPLIIESLGFAFGLLFLGWSPYLVLLGYWAMEILLPIFGSFKNAIFRFHGGKTSCSTNCAMILIPLVHGIFFLFLLSTSAGNGNSHSAEIYEALRTLNFTVEIWFVLGMALLASFVDFVWGYVLVKGYLRSQNQLADSQGLLIVIMHFVLFFTFIIAEFFNMPDSAGFFLVLFRLIVGLLV